MNTKLGEDLQEQADRLISVLGLPSDTELRRLLEAAADKVEEYDELRGVLDESERAVLREEQRADRAEEALEEALPLIHASHGGECLADLRLCPHPDCTRFTRRRT